MSTITIDVNQYPEAAMYAKLHNISFKQLVENLLMKFQTPTVAENQPLGGCLKGVESSEDEKFNYLMEKYK